MGRVDKYQVPGKRQRRLHLQWQYTIYQAYQTHQAYQTNVDYRTGILFAALSTVNKYQYRYQEIPGTITSIRILYIRYQVPGDDWQCS